MPEIWAWFRGGSLRGTRFQSCRRLQDRIGIVSHEIATRSQSFLNHAGNLGLVQGRQFTWDTIPILSASPRQDWNRVPRDRHPLAIVFEPCWRPELGSGEAVYVG